MNKELWQNYEKFGRARGRLVADILSHYLNISGKNILDFGCGAGEVAAELSRQGANVTAFDVNEAKLKSLQITAENLINFKVVSTCPGRCSQFDVIVLLDVLEHLIFPRKVLKELNCLLKPDGLLYLSTPNKFSIVNVLMDPHFSLPFLALCDRENVKRVVADLLTWQPQSRIDFPELLSLKEINRVLCDSGFKWHFVNTHVTDYALKHPESVWNRPLHLSIIAMLQRIHARTLLQKIITNNLDFFNVWLNPTWYIIAQKKPDSLSRNPA